MSEQVKEKLALPADDTVPKISIASKRAICEALGIEVKPSLISVGMMLDHDGVYVEARYYVSDLVAGNIANTLRNYRLVDTSTMSDSSKSAV